jgi:hypothetical protein
MWADPRGWEHDLPYAPIWLDPAEGLFAVLDAEDHAWARQWMWDITWDRHGRKPYATRMITLEGRRVKVFLHKAVLVRSGKRPPTPNHKIGDHQDGESLNCRRGNLEWATPSMNRRNIKGQPYLALDKYLKA